MSLVARLLLLIVLAAVPILGTQLYAQVELWRERETAERAVAARLASLVSSDMIRIAEGMKGILIAVSQLNFIQQFDGPACDAYLAGLAKNYPQLFNITVIDANAHPICANTPIPPNATASDRLYFHEAISRDSFVVGDYIVGRAIRQPQLPVAMPVTDASGNLLVISIGIRIDWLQQQLRALALPDRATLIIADRTGTIVAAPQAPETTGHRLPPFLRPIMAPQRGTLRHKDSDGSIHIIGYEPVNVEPEGLAIAVDLSESPALADRINKAGRDLGIFFVSVLIAVGIAIIGAGRALTQPLRRLTDAASAWAGGNFQIRAALPDTASEIGRLGVAFDHMADVIERDRNALRQANETLELRVAERTAALAASNRQLETEMAERQAAEAALRQSQKMEAIGQLTGGIAHDFNNLLTSIGGSIEFLSTFIPPGNVPGVERAERFAEMGRSSVARAARMTHRLLAFARQQPLEVEVVDVNRLVSGMAELLNRTLGSGVEIETVLAGGLWPTRTDPAQLENALLNLCINGRDAMAENGRLTIETANAALDRVYAAQHPEVEPGQYVMLAVTDTGSGMPPEVAARAFDPFFSTKRDGRGTGLGLSMVYGFVKQSGGHIKIYSEPGRGTTVKIYLPRLLSAASAAHPGTESAAITVRDASGETILVVEDDPDVREMSVAFVTDLGYRALAAADAEAALQLLAEHPEIAVLFTDVVLGPGADGRKLAERAQAIRPGLPVLFTTGYTPNAIIHGGILDAGVHLLTKPFGPTALDAALRRALGRSER